MSETSNQDAVGEAGASALRAALQAAGQVAFECRPGDGALSWPGAPDAVLGHPASSLDALGRFLDHVHPDDQLLAQAVLAGSTGTVATQEPPEFRFRDATGGWRRLALRGAATLPGEVPRVVGVLAEVVRRPDAERLIQLQARILDGQREAVLVADDADRIVWHNPAFASLVGAGGSLLTGRSLQEFERASPARRIERRQEVRDAVARRGSWHGRVDVVRADGSTAVTDTLVTAFENDGVTLWLHVRRDVTERVELDEVATDATRLEQQRLGLALHDGLGQELAGTSMLVRTLRNALGAGAEPDAALVRDVESLLQASVARCRELAQGLAPFVIDDDGIGAAIADLAARSGRARGVSVRAVVCPRAAALDGNFGLQVYRLVQAALVDAIGREGTTAVTLEVWREEDDRLALAIVADGRIVEPPSPESRLFGHWLAQLGGSAEPLDASRGRRGLIAMLPVPRGRQAAPEPALARRSA